VKAVSILTPGSLVDLVLDEEIHHRDDGCKESKLDLRGLRFIIVSEPTNAEGISCFM
jgi:hypothetical protein